MMKGVKCSWVDMLKVRDALALAERGDQKRLEHLRCVDKSTVSGWQRTLDLMAAVDGKVYLSKLSHFQPTHAREISRTYRKKVGNADKWTDEIKDEIADWVDRCEAEEWTVEELRDALLANGTEPKGGPGCTEEDLQKLIDDGEQFGTIYADPPWAYSNQTTRASTDNHYLTMTVDQICALPIRELAADCCHLHLWTTNAFLFECPRIFDAWGFTYQGVFVWCKPQMGIGNCWRVSHEILLLAIKGEPRRFRVRNLKSWGEFDRDKHSSKPEKVRLMIEKASPPAYLELFGRQDVQGWTVWGNQIEKSMFHNGRTYD